MANHITINILNEAIDDDKSNKCNKVCDHSNYHKYIPLSWSKIVPNEIQKRLKILNTNIIEKVNYEEQKLSKKIITLKVVHLKEIFRTKVHSNVLISLLKNNLKIISTFQMQPSDCIIIMKNYWISK